MKPAHGTTARYYAKCRCDECRAAYSENKKAYRASKPKSSNAPHGTATRYDTGGCRCDQCRAARRSYRANHPAKSKSPHGTLSRYTNGKCRCDECRAASNRHYKLKAAEKRLLAGPRGIRIGRAEVMYRQADVEAWADDIDLYMREGIAAVISRRPELYR